MRSALALGAIVALTTGCGPAKDRVWLFTFGTTEVLENDATCDENFTAAACPTPEDPQPSDWTQTRERERSDGAFFGEILDLPSGEMALVLGDDVLIGSKDSGRWTFTWTGEEHSIDQDSHTTGYVYGSDTTIKTTTAVSLDFSGDTATGTLTDSYELDRRVYESDGWLADEVGHTYGRIFDNAPAVLEGERTNLNDRVECTDAECFIQAVARSETSTPLRAWRTGADDDAFEGVRDVTREPGADD